MEFNLFLKGLHCHSPHTVLYKHQCNGWSGQNTDWKSTKVILRKYMLWTSNWHKSMQCSSSVFRCFMLFEVQGSSNDAFIIHINGSTLRFTRREFASISGSSVATSCQIVLSILRNQTDFYVSTLDLKEALLLINN